MLLEVGVGLQSQVSNIPSGLDSREYRRTTPAQLLSWRVKIGGVPFCDRPPLHLLHGELGLGCASLGVAQVERPFSDGLCGGLGESSGML